MIQIYILCGYYKKFIGCTKYSTMYRQRRGGTACDLLVKSRFMRTERTQNSHWSEVPHELISCKYLTLTTFRNVILAGIQSVALKP